MSSWDPWWTSEIVNSTYLKNMCPKELGLKRSGKETLATAIGKEALLGWRGRLGFLPFHHLKRYLCPSNLVISRLDTVNGDHIWQTKYNYQNWDKQANVLPLCRHSCSLVYVIGWCDSKSSKLVRTKLKLECLHLQYFAFSGKADILVTAPV